MHRLLRAALILENDQNLRRALTPSDDVVAVILPAGSGWMFARPGGITFSRESPHKSIPVQLPLDVVTSTLERGAGAIQRSGWQRYSMRASSLLHTTEAWRRGMKWFSGKCLCCAAHGLSCLITARIGDTSHSRGENTKFAVRNRQPLSIRS